MSEENLTGKCFLYNDRYQFQRNPPINVNDQQIYLFNEKDYEIYINGSKQQFGIYSLLKNNITLIDQIYNQTYNLEYGNGKLIDNNNPILKNR
jgi:hypothetical protein